MILQPLMWPDKPFRHRKTYEFMSPEGEHVIVCTGLNTWCEDNGLNKAAMSEVHSGRVPHHKGWVKYTDGSVKAVTEEQSLSVVKRIFNQITAQVLDSKTV